MTTTTEDIRCESGTCSACWPGGSLDPRTTAEGKRKHAMTEFLRRRAGLPPIGTKPAKLPKRTTCSRCAVAMDDRTPGCPTCDDRHAWRAWNVRRVERFERSRAQAEQFGTQRVDPPV